MGAGSYANREGVQSNFVDPNGNEITGVVQNRGHGHPRANLGKHHWIHRCNRLPDWRPGCPNFVLYMDHTRARKRQQRS